MSEAHTDFDSPWKIALEWYFEEFMLFFFPTAYADIDWSKGVEFLDKELQQVVRDASLGRRYADKLAKVWKKNGEEEWVLAHVEVQGEHETNFERRMYSYNYRLFDRYNRYVASFAVLADESTKWRPGKFSYELWGSKIDFAFPVIKLVDYVERWAELETSDNPFATVVMAHLKAQETQHDPQARYDAKFYLIRRLYERGYQREDIVKLFHFIDWVMRLPQDLEAGFWQELQQLEEERRMQYVTSVERIGIEKGRQEGILRALLRLLEHRFGQIQEAMRLRLQPMTAEQLEELLDVALTAKTLDEIVARLPASTTSEPAPEESKNNGIA